MIILTTSDLKTFAQALGIEPALLYAVDKVESAGCGYYLSEGKWKGQLKVLFEGHYFDKATKGQFRAKRPDLSYPKWTTKYYRRGQQEFSRYMEARALNKEAALLSTSWGRYQIMGSNYKVCGYDSVTEMVQSFYTGGEPEQFLAFINFLNNKQGVTKNRKLTGTSLFNHLKNKEFEHFIGGYNGLGKVAHYKKELLLNYGRGLKEIK
jgi:hypothetical protein